ncbi:hypothetical protein BST63_16460 [Bradyrhizobium canariense]|uniref:Lipoprotein n=1 Tax=Bradyrhizobium canariense TaxID=255045 RepID=A0ABX3X4R7_9BRAD|nr:hypothetical protein [Bradyrhizobium canariense]OSJ13534.1 hypothetical protein BSR47_21005 [Bradyrhizobium canariense]OSJ28748.1 hypothetical protein BST63_16460 [Bradyrhizobium canariense]
MQWIARIALLSTLCCGACSIYPLPEDTTSFDSDRIASVIRCQTRDAIRRVIVALIATGKDRVVYRGMTGYQTAAWLEQQPAHFHEVKWEQITDTKIRAPLLFYKDTSVSYDFTIDTTEVNTAGVNVTLVKKLFVGNDSIGLVAKNDRTREVKRHFRAYDSFDSLARLMKEETCDGMPQQVNALYPATGLLRIDSLVNSFLLANQWGNLAGDDANYTTAQMTDTLTFTTKFTGNVDPSTAIDPVTGRFVPSSASLNIDNSRQDLHTILILLRLPPNTKGLPQFDEYGRIIAPGYVGQKAAASAALDRQRDFNTQDALTKLGTGIGRVGPGL